MSKEEDRGLLSRMVRFVRNPTVSWSDLDHGDVDSESRYSKQMLKDMIERRRRNDFVRKREFDMLRKLRREHQSGVAEAARPSFFPSSGGQNNKPDERAKTIKKIDEIEAQMSQQWWKTKHDGDVDEEEAVEDRDNPNTDFSGSFRGALTSSDGRAASQPDTQPLMSGPRFAAADADGPGLKAGARRAEARKAAATDSQLAGFTYSKLNAIQVAEFVHDPLLEEAAIRFANGDDDGAEAALREAMASPDPAISGNEAIWLTLFDLYRATDRQDRFDDLSLDFANRFGRTAPVWFSIPRSVRMVTPTTSDSGVELEPLWKAPTQIDASTLIELKGVLDKAPQPWCLAWSSLVAIDEDALDPLLRLFSAWADQSVKLRFYGGAHLLEVLKSGTVSGDSAINPLWWRLRMEVLRVMHRPDEFEVAAMDYCVTYELSPPSWDSALCNYKSLDGSSSQITSPPTLIGESHLDGTPSTLPDTDFSETERTVLAATGSSVSAVDLSGHIMGDAVEMLEALNAKLEGADLIIVVCTRLVRLDFLAAGTLLNWVSARRAEGRQVQFKDLNRLVAIFFNVVGINEYAKVIARTN